MKQGELRNEVLVALTGKYPMLNEQLLDTWLREILRTFRAELAVPYFDNFSVEDHKVALPYLFTYADRVYCSNPLTEAEYLKCGCMGKEYHEDTYMVSYSGTCEECKTATAKHSYEEWVFQPHGERKYYKSAMEIPRIEFINTSSKFGDINNTNGYSVNGLTLYVPQKSGTVFILFRGYPQKDGEIDFPETSRNALVTCLREGLYYKAYEYLSHVVDLNLLKISDRYRQSYQLQIPTARADLRFLTVHDFQSKQLHRTAFRSNIYEKILK